MAPKPVTAADIASRYHHRHHRRRRRRRRRSCLAAPHQDGLLLWVTDRRWTILQHEPYIMTTATAGN